MKFSKFMQTTIIACVACVFALTLAACSSGASDEKKAAQENRQYMSSLNHQMTDLQTVMDDFQVAVSEQNAVAMEAQLEKAESIKSDIEKQDATSSLSGVKDQYVEALASLNDAMDMYVNVYERARDGSLAGDELTEELKKVQDAYDKGMQGIEAADDAVASMAGE